MEEESAHGAFSRPDQFSFFEGHIHLLAGTGAEDVCSQNGTANFVGQRRFGRSIGVSERLQEFEDWPSHRSSGPGMRKQADAVRAGGALNAWLSSDEGLHYIQMSQHGRRENRRMRSVAKQELRNWPVSHVRRR